MDGISSSGTHAAPLSPPPDPPAAAGHGGGAAADDDDDDDNGTYCPVLDQLERFLTSLSRRC